MSLLASTNPFVSTDVQTISISSILSQTTSGPNPTSLFLTAEDLNVYTVGATGQTGYFSGNGNTMAMSVKSVATLREAGILFQYDASSGQYLNATFGNVTNVTFTTSGSQGDVTDLGLFATNVSWASNLTEDVTSLMFDSQYNSLGANSSLGTTTLLTSTGTPTAVDAEHNATQQGIAAAAQTMVGQAADHNGCWVVASTISALAGASLPFASLFTYSAMDSGEWFTAFNGQKATDNDFQSMLRVGDVVTFVTTSGNGHVTTVVAGSGRNASIIDNANFGSNMISGTDDLIIQPQHGQYQELDGVSASSVTIYRLDSPITTAGSANFALGAGNALSLADGFSAVDPAGTALTRYELRAGNAADILVRNGERIAPTAAGTYVVSSLANVRLLAQTADGSHTVGVRAYNGTYWGDWADGAVTPDAAGGFTAPVIAPTTLIAGISISFDSGASSTDFVTNMASQTITAQLSAALGDGEALMGSVDGGASWTDVTSSISGTTVTWSGATLQGTSSIWFKVTNQGSEAPTATQAYVLDTTAPTTAGNVRISNDTGSSATDFVTNAAVQTITATLGARLAAGDRLFGSLDGGQQWIDVTAFANGTAVTWAGAVLAPYASSIQFQTVDLAGNVGATTSRAYVLDVVAPDASTPVLAAASDSGALGDGITRFATPTVTGTAEAGSVVRIYESDDFMMVGSGTAASDGTYSIALAHLSDGTHLLHATAKDAAGNVGVASAPTVLTIDTAAPGMPWAPVLAETSDTGAIGDGITGIRTPTITGDGAEAGSTVSLYDGLTVVGSAIANRLGAHAITPSAMADGAHALSVRATDAAGNVGAPSSTTRIVIDSVAPDAPGAPTLAAASDSGIRGDGITNAFGPTVEGNAEAGSRVAIYDADGTTLLGNGTAATDGSYSIRLVPLPNGTHALTARATDAAGNEGASSAPFALTMDATPPTTTVAGVTLSAGSDGTGMLVATLETETISGTLGATLGAGDALMGSTDGGRSWTDVTASVTGTTIAWAATLSGTDSIQFRVVDAAGNLGIVSVIPYSVQIPQPVVVAPVVDVPVTVTPVVDVPVVVTPVVVTPVMDVPVVTVPVVDVPVVITPVVTVPVVTPVEVDPVITQPVITQPTQDAPVTTTPVVTTPVTAPVAAIPEAAPVDAIPQPAPIALIAPTDPTLALVDATNTQPSPTAVPRTADDAGMTFRFFDSTHGTQFMTSSISERDALISTRPDLSYEGKGMGTVQSDPNDRNVASVFRFFSKLDGTHFFTTSASEKDETIATRSDLTYEGSNFNEHLAAQAGDVAVYRFFNGTNGSHFFTSSDTERALLAATRPDMVNEGIAFYSPKV